MPGEGRPPPSRFPCLCRAIYSWGGEVCLASIRATGSSSWCSMLIRDGLAGKLQNPGDLGFVEGDLIECLNAGDGQWWMGRLRRNREVGPFPSNFVEILEDPGPPPLKRPVSRAESASPMPFPGGGGGGSLTRSHSPAPPRQTRNVSPREGYEYDTYPRRPIQKRISQYGDVSPERVYQQRPRPRAADPHYQDRPVSRARSPAPPAHFPRAVSPGRSGYQHSGRDVSPARSHYQPDYRRGASPNRSHYQLNHQREVSPARSQYQDRRAVSPVPSHYRVPSPAFTHHARAPSPVPPVHYQRPRATSPMPPNMYNQRAISPVPPMHLSRQPSPEHAMMYDDNSAPPPPPPPHQHLTPGNSRAPSPHQHTPSPLRSAMEDVMSSLEHMVSHDNHDYAVDRATTPHIVDDPWSPHAFRDEFSATPSRIVRPHTSLGVGAHNFDIDDDDDDDDDPYGSRYPVQQPPGGSYSESMQDRVRRFPVANNDDMPPPPPPKRYTNDDLTKQCTPEDISAIKRPLTANFAEKRKSMYDLPARGLGSSNAPLSRNTTVKSSATSASYSSNAQSVATNSTGLTSISLMSGQSAGCTSATSAGSYNRRKRTLSVVEGTTFRPQLLGARPETPISAIGSGSGYGSGSASGSGIGPSLLRKSWRGPAPSNIGASESDPALFRGYEVPKPKKAGIIKTLINRAKATTASAKSTFNYTPPLPTLGPVVINKGPGDVITGIQGGQPQLQKPAHGWAEVRRDVNRSNSLSRPERDERCRRVQMLGHTVLRPVDVLDDDVDGDAAADGKTAVRDPADFVNASNLAIVDKTARFINNLPMFTTPESLATMHICKSYRTEVQKLRAIFTWLSEKIAWERPMPPVDGVEVKMDLRRVLQVKRGSPEEVANIVMLMCRAVGIEAEVIPGYLKAPGEMFEAADIPPPNHFWNAVVCEGEWRMMDCSLASHTHPRRGLYSGASNTTTEFHYFLTPPSRMCWTHVPSQPRHQHMVPPLPLCQLLALPVVTSVFFQHDLKVQDFDTSLIRLEGLEALQIDVGVPVDIELIAEVEARNYAIDAADGEIYESDQVIKKRALAQVSWESGHKTCRIKAVTPGDVGAAVLKVYAGKKGLMHSIKDNPHPLAFCLPIAHTGENPLYDFIPRHPTPHATRHDLYVAQPQCYYLGLNNTYVFAVRQHLSTGAPSTTEKPAKLALQTPTGKILRLMKKGDTLGCENGVVWETIVKVTEAGAWRALVLADRSHRWCVYAEWHVS